MIKGKFYLKHEKTSAAYIGIPVTLLRDCTHLGTADQIPTWRLYLSLERWIQTTMLNNSTMKPTVKVNQKRYIVIPVYCDTFSNFT